MTLTLARLHEVLEYYPDAGIFVWKVGPFHNQDMLGQQAGDLQSKLYWRISVDRKRYFAHRLAWFYMTGEWPPQCIDHINGDKLDNRFSNLRLATNSLNGANRGSQRNNTSGLKGVSWVSRKGKWKAQAGHKHLGLFESAEDAHAAYCVAARNMYGDFARTQ